MKIVDIKFEFLGALKNDHVFYGYETFEEMETIFVSKVIDPDGRQILLPPYVAEKDLPGLLQSIAPTGRVCVLESQHLN